MMVGGRAGGIVAVGMTFKDSKERRQPRKGTPTRARRPASLESIPAPGGLPAVLVVPRDVRLVGTERVGAVAPVVADVRHQGGGSPRHLKTAFGHNIRQRANKSAYENANPQEQGRTAQRMGGEASDRAWGKVLVRTFRLPLWIRPGRSQGF